MSEEKDEGGIVSACGPNLKSRHVNHYIHSYSKYSPGIYILSAGLVSDDAKMNGCIVFVLKALMV